MEVITIKLHKIVNPEKIVDPGQNATYQNSGQKVRRLKSLIHHSCLRIQRIKYRSRSCMKTGLDAQARSREKSWRTGSSCAAQSWDRKKRLRMLELASKGSASHILALREQNYPWTMAWQSDHPFSALMTHTTSDRIKDLKQAVSWGPRTRMKWEVLEGSVSRRVRPSLGNSMPANSSTTTRLRLDLRTSRMHLPRMMAWPI